MKVKRIPGIVVTLTDGTLPTPTDKVLLDSEGFPWLVDSINGNDIRIVPAREPSPQEVYELVPFDVGAPRAKFNRLVDYMSCVEALDLEIKEVQISPDTVLAGYPKEFPTSLCTSGHMLGLDEVVLVTNHDGYHVSWGPLPLSPMKTRVPWPFAASITSSVRRVFMEPQGKGHGSTVRVRDEHFRYDLHTPQDALRFALTVVANGWEFAVKECCPHGVLLADGGAPRAFNEFEVGG
jgi:hypothetical protein